MPVVVPINTDHEIVDYIFEESERLPNDFYVHIMDLMKKYHDNRSKQVYNEIHSYLLKNENRINNDIFKKIKERFPEKKIEYFKKLKKWREYIYRITVTLLIVFMLLLFISVIVVIIIKR